MLYWRLAFGPLGQRARSAARGEEAASASGQRPAGQAGGALKKAPAPHNAANEYLGLIERAENGAPRAYGLCQLGRPHKWPVVGRVLVPEAVRLFRGLRFCVLGPVAFIKTEIMG
jgi:hypothetical protein